MHGLYCDACQEPLLVDSQVRYVVKIEVYAAYDPLEITEDDLAGATPERMHRLIQSMQDSDQTELNDQVYQALQYDLCPPCRRRYLADPIKAAKGESAQDSGRPGGVS